MQLEPEPRILIESLRDIGYSFNSALADIVDNSITAKARISQSLLFLLMTSELQSLMTVRGLAEMS